MDVRQQLKDALLADLNLEDISPEDIGDETLLFGEGLGLDSLDAVEIVVLVQRNFGVEIKDMDEAKMAFQSFGTLVSFIEERRGRDG